MCTLALSPSCRSLHDGVVSPRRHGLRAEAEAGVGGQVAREVVPQAVDEHAAEVEDRFGAVAAPTHPRAIEADTDEVPDGALDDAASDVEVGATELGVLHARRVLDEVVVHGAEHLAAVLV